MGESTDKSSLEKSLIYENTKTFEERVETGSSGNDEHCEHCMDGVGCDLHKESIKDETGPPKGYSRLANISFPPWVDRVEAGALTPDEKKTPVELELADFFIEQVKKVWEAWDRMRAGAQVFGVTLPESYIPIKYGNREYHWNRNVESEKDNLFNGIQD